jgi:uncharacterized repeat protein (TIGR03806 family)
VKSVRWLTAALCLAACSEAEPSRDSGGPGDLGAAADGGVNDLGQSDQGVDAGEPDADLPDLGPADTGILPWGEVVVDINLPRPPALLSEYRLVRLENGVLRYNDRVVPYELAAPLFSDYAIKERAIWVPPGTQVNYQDLEAFDFPIGSAIIKSFSFAPDLRQPEVGRRVIETRVLVKYADGWQALPYLWRPDGSDADYHVRGHVEMVDFIDPFGAPRRATYLVPQKNQCTSCHELSDGQGGTFTTIIGPKARYLNRLELGPGAPINQLERWVGLGILAGLPTLDQVPTAAALTTYGSTVGWTAPELERAARDYLDINCAHCHNPQALQGVTSQLYLNVDNTDEFRLGYCKEPGSAGSGAGGRRYDIVPGHPDDSIVTYRIESERAGEMMPLLGRSLADTFGTRVVRGWIQSLPSRNCD